MSVGIRRMAMVSMHTSPIAAPGRADASGMTVALLNLARGLAGHGVEVDLLTRATGEPEVTELSRGVTLRTLAAGPLAPLPQSGMADVADEFGEAVASLVGRQGSRYDLLHAHFWLSGLATLPVAIELGLPLVQSFHSLGFMKNAALAPGDVPATERRLYSEAFLAAEVDAVIAGSAAEVATLIDDLKAPPRHLWVIPPGVDIELFTPTRASGAPDLRRRLGIEAGRPLLVVAAEIQPLKAQELAVRVLGAVHALRGWAPILVLAGDQAEGADGYRDYLIALATELGVRDDVRFVGALGRTDIADLLAAATLTLVPSRTETFGLVAIESAASGTPVVGYRSAGLLASVAEGESGALLATRNSAEWARTVSDLLDDEAALLRLGQSARKHAEGFTWATSAASLLGVYEGLTGPRTRRSV